QSVHDDSVRESRQVHVGVRNRRSGELRVISRGVAGVLLIVPKFLGYVVRIERSQYSRPYVVFSITAGSVGSPQNAAPVLRAVGRNRQDRPALARRSRRTRHDLTLWEE